MLYSFFMFSNHRHHRRRCRGCARAGGALRLLFFLSALLKVNELGPALSWSRREKRMWWVQHDTARRRRANQNIMKSDDDVEEWEEMRKQTKTEGIPRISYTHFILLHILFLTFRPIIVFARTLHRLLLFIHVDSYMYICVHWTILMSSRFFLSFCLFDQRPDNQHFFTRFVFFQQWNLTRMLIVKQWWVATRPESEGVKCTLAKKKE